jgi:hypothetical protein
MASEAQAQFGFGGFGWGGWGSTVQGDIEQGLGALDLAAGQYNLDTGQANAINNQTAARWNQAVWRSQRELNAANYLRRKRREARVNAALADMYDRLRNNPETRDIIVGDALNVVRDILVNPSASGAAFRTLKDPIDPRLIPEIPFAYASEMMTICLNEITTTDGWPRALRAESFQPQREALRKAIQMALDEDRDDDLSEETVRAVGTAVQKLRQKFEQEVPPTDPTYYEARDYLKTLAGLTRILYSPKADEILAALETYRGTTLGDLLAFMQSFNLRFGPARSFQQRQIYLSLYPMLARQTNPIEQVVNSRASKVSGSIKSAKKTRSGGRATTEADAQKIGKRSGRAAKPLFRGMDWKNFDISGGPAPRPPPPSPPSPPRQP